MAQFARKTATVARNMIPNPQTISLHRNRGLLKPKLSIDRLSTSLREMKTEIVIKPGNIKEPIIFELKTTGIIDCRIPPLTINNNQGIVSLKKATKRRMPTE
jgi:hypothetical protein